MLAIKGSAADFLADVITRQLAPILEDIAGDDAHKLKRQLELVNALLVMLRRRLRSSGGSNEAGTAANVVDPVSSPLRVLRAVQRDQQFPASPKISLAVPWLFTAGKGLRGRGRGCGCGRDCDGNGNGNGDGDGGCRGRDKVFMTCSRMRSDAEGAVESGSRRRTCQR